MRLEMPDSQHQLILGVDLGSSGLKGVLLSVSDGIVASETYEIDLYSDSPGWSEADPAQWWRGLRVIVGKLIDTVGCSASDIKAVAISGMVPAVVIADSAGNALRRAMLQNDARATHEIDELSGKFAGIDLLSLTGSKLTQQSVAPTALWLSRHEPSLWSRTKYIFGSYDWMAFKLGSIAHVERNWAIESGLYNWDGTPLEEVISGSGLIWPALLPIRDSGDVVGEVSNTAANETGLATGTPIVVGGADHVLSAYGAGLFEEGDCLIKLGGAGDILAVSDDRFLDERLYLDSHPAPNKWLPNGCMATSGSILRWEQHLLGDLSLDALDVEARSSKPGALLAQPYFLGEKSPLHDPDLRGAVVGLHLGTTRGDIHRSFLEAIAYGFRQHADIFESGGLHLVNTKVTNGGSKSRLWREILADVLNRPLTSIIHHPGASYGAAVVAGIGIGLIDSWRYVEGSLEEGEVILPNPENIELYAERYQMYLSLTSQLTPISHALARSEL